MNHLFTNLDAALFDLDGTLVETNIDFPLMRREVERLAISYGVNDPEILALDILSIADMLTEHVRHNKGDAAAAAAQSEAFALLEEIELRHSADAREIRPARELVEALRSRDIKVGVVTRNCRAASEESLARAGIQPDVLVCRQDVEQAKPCPNHLLAALDILSARPERSVMVGDHPMDIEAGKSAGMATIGVLTRDHTPDYFSSDLPDAVANDLSEVLRAVVDSDR